jgi:hypothetical protein
VGPQAPGRGAGIENLLHHAAYFPIFSVPDPRVPNRPVFHPEDPQKIVAIEVCEELHRLRVETDMPPNRNEIQVSNRAGERVAAVRMRWALAPEEFTPEPGLEPPPTAFDPMRSQPFTMLDAAMEFDDEARSGFSAFGHGRTFPMIAGGEPRIFVASVVNVEQGFGRFAGLVGNCVTNGRIKPPGDLAIGLFLRLMDPNRRLYGGATRPIQEIANPDPDVVTLMLRGEPEPGFPITRDWVRDGGHETTTHEALRLVDADFDLFGPNGLRSRIEPGPIAGSLETRLTFDPLDARGRIPIRTRNAEFRFFDRNHKVFGTLAANMVEGEAFRTPVPGTSRYIFRFAGFGPIEGGDGRFQGAAGIMSLNGAICVDPELVSNMYILRTFDPERRFRMRE